MEKQDFINDWLKNGVQVLFNFVAEGSLPEGRGLMTFLYDEEAVDYCYDNPGEWVLYLSVIVRPEEDAEFDPYLSFSPGLLRRLESGEWEHKYYLEYLTLK